MSTRVLDLMVHGFAGVRYEPTTKRIRALAHGRTVVDSTRAVLLWEPRRILPGYAVPGDDVLVAARPGDPPPPVGDDVGIRMPTLSDRPLLDPSVPFAVHSADGRVLDLDVDGAVLPGAAFRLDDPQLDGYVVLDFDAFEWLEEDEPTFVHPKDPFHSVDILAGSRVVRLELDGEVLAESKRPTLLFETFLPVRYYLPREDVRVELRPSGTRTRCPYKGEASYFSPVAGGHPVPDLVWTYPDPLDACARIRDLVCFFDERVDVVLDGERRPRPLTPWS
jgi:uncharacterized protein (DUF427 family)